MGCEHTHKVLVIHVKNDGIGTFYSNAVVSVKVLINDCQGRHFQLSELSRVVLYPVCLFKDVWTYIGSRECFDVGLMSRIVCRISGNSLSTSGQLVYRNFGTWSLADAILPPSAGSPIGVGVAVRDLNGLAASDQLVFVARGVILGGDLCAQGGGLYPPPKVTDVQKDGLIYCSLKRDFGFSGLYTASIDCPFRNVIPRRPFTQCSFNTSRRILMQIIGITVLGRHFATDIFRTGYARDEPRTKVYHCYFGTSALGLLWCALIREGEALLSSPQALHWDISKSRLVIKTDGRTRNLGRGCGCGSCMLSYLSAHTPHKNFGPNITFLPGVKICLKMTDLFINNESPFTGFLR